MENPNKGFQVLSGLPDFSAQVLEGGQQSQGQQGSRAQATPPITNFSLQQAALQQAALQQLQQQQLAAQSQLVGGMSNFGLGNQGLQQLAALQAAQMGINMPQMPAFQAADQLNFSLLQQFLGQQPGQVASSQAMSMQAGLQLPTMALPNLEQAAQNKDTTATRSNPRSKSETGTSSAYASRHQAAEQRRRTRINERLERLRKIVPHAERANTATFLEEVINYIDKLKKEIAELKGEAPPAPEGAPAGAPGLIEGSGVTIPPTSTTGSGPQGPLPVGGPMGPPAPTSSGFITEGLRVATSSGLVMEGVKAEGVKFEGSAIPNPFLVSSAAQPPPVPTVGQQMG